MLTLAERDRIESELRQSAPAGLGAWDDASLAHVRCGFAARGDDEACRLIDGELARRAARWREARQGARPVRSPQTR